MSTPRGAYETAPPPFVPPVDTFPNFHRRQMSYPLPSPRSQAAAASMKPAMYGSFAHPAMPRSMASQPAHPMVPYPPRPDASAFNTRLPPRPIGHGRSGSSAPSQPRPGEPAVLSKPQEEKALPQAPTPGGLGLFVTQEAQPPLPQQPLPPLPQQPLPPLPQQPQPPLPQQPLLQQPLPAQPQPPLPQHQHHSHHPQPPPKKQAPPPPPPPVAPRPQQVPPSTAPLFPKSAQPRDVPNRRPTPVRRATVGECERIVPGADSETEVFIKNERTRLDLMWEEEQAQLQREMAAERKRYEEGRARNAIQHQPAYPRRKSTSPETHTPQESESPVINEHGIPTPPPTLSPPSKALKRCVSTKEDRDRWRNEIRQVIGEQMKKQTVAKAEHDMTTKETEEERLRHENARRDRARREAERVRVPHRDPSPAPAMAGPSSLRDIPFASQSARKTSPTKREQEVGRQRRKRAVEETHVSRDARSPDRTGAPAYWRATRPKRYYGEGETDLREEGVCDGRPVVEEVEEEEEAPAPVQAQVDDRNYLEARLAKAAWDLYESRWAAFFSSPPKENSLRFVDIPWPSLEPLPLPNTPRSPSKLHTIPPSALQISAVLNKKAIGSFLLSPYHSTDKSHRARLRAALLRFHPDKVSRWMSLVQESERNAVVMAVEVVVRCLNDLLKTIDDPMA
ncbi:hypothetical protein FRB99_001355 [Tulasnella sp. 403]|nr:hypothetical protein FRB99_001355 [Tulasnella sp. 403]